MKLVVIESPYAGDIERNVRYAQRALLYCLDHNEAPIASHLLYTQVLKDALPEERKHGIEAGYAWMQHAEVVAFFTDYGMSSGMDRALMHAVKLGKKIEYRHIGSNPTVEGDCYGEGFVT